MAQGPDISLPPIPQHEPHEGAIILKDGTTAYLRPLSEEDKPLLETFLQSLSSQSLSRRFFSTVAPDSVASFSRFLLTIGNPEECYALAAFGGDPGRPFILAVGNYVRITGTEVAEVAFLVHDHYRGRGLGTLLLERLALIAVRHGIRAFTALTHAGNREMLNVFRDSGFPIEETGEDGYVTVSLSVLPDRESVARAEMRDRLATIASLRPIFSPRSVAVIGASRDPGSIGYRVFRNLIVNRFNGPVYPVNPRAEVVSSVLAYKSILDVPGHVDLAIIAVPRDQVMPVVDECGRKGVRALVVLTAGFAETGPDGRRLQQELVRQVHGYGMRLVGPNCLGLLNTDPGISLNASFSPVFPPAGNVAMSSQSGALGLAILEYAQELGLGLSAFISVGNKADVSGNDLIQYFEEDPNTDLILLYLESFGNPRRFARLARRVARKKPILAVKAGRTGAGRRAAGSHTAALAASDVAVDALFQQAGVIRADKLEDMFDIAAFLANQPLPPGPRVGIVTNAGGPAILCADACEAGGLLVPDLSADTKQRLASFLPPAASLSNPVDMIASADAHHYRQAVETVLLDPGIDALVVIFIPAGLADSERVAAAIQEAVTRARERGARDKPVLACFMGARGLRSPLSNGQVSIPSYRFPESAALALSKSWRYAEWRRQPLGVIPRLDRYDPDTARGLCRAVQGRGGGWLGYEEIQALLSAAGLPILQGKLTRSPEEAVAAAEEMGYPVVAKMSSRTMVHKTEFDGVRLHLTGPDEVKRAFDQVTEGVRRAGRLDELDGVLIQPMVTEGVEVMVGVTDDDLFGPLIAFGLGGIHVEVLEDISFRITPLTDLDAAQMISDIKGRKLLEGYRGHAPADMAALQDILLRTSQLVLDVPEIVELDFNPIKALEPGRGCVILDARIRVAASPDTV